CLSWSIQAFVINYFLSHCVACWRKHIARCSGTNGFNDELTCGHDQWQVACERCTGSVIQIPIRWRNSFRYDRDTGQGLATDRIWICHLSICLRSTCSTCNAFAMAVRCTRKKLLGGNSASQTPSARESSTIEPFSSQTSL